MIQKRVFTGVVGSLVLAAVFIGCGNSTKANIDLTGLEPGTEAKGSIDSIISGKENTFILTGTTEDGTGEAGSVKLSKTYDSAGNEVCLTAEEACSCSVDLEATTCTERVEADDKYTTEDGEAVLAYLLANSAAYNYDSTKDMVVYGGTLLPIINGFCVGNLKIDVKGMACGHAIMFSDPSTTVQAGFSNPGHTVFAMITRDGEAPQFTAIGTMDANGNFTIDLTGIDLCGSNVEVSLFSIKTANKSGTTGGSSS